MSSRLAAMLGVFVLSLFAVPHALAQGSFFTSLSGTVADFLSGCGHSRRRRQNQKQRDGRRIQHHHRQRTAASTCRRSRAGPTPSRSLRSWGSRPRSL